MQQAQGNKHRLDFLLLLDARVDLLLKLSEASQLYPFVSEFLQVLRRLLQLGLFGLDLTFQSLVLVRKKGRT